MQIYQISWIWLRNILQKVKLEKAIKDMEEEIKDKEEKLEEIDGYKNESRPQEADRGKEKRG